MRVAAANAILHDGEYGPFSGPLALIAVAFLSGQSRRLNVTRPTDDPAQKQHLQVSVSQNWDPPTLSFDCLAWWMSQVCRCHDCRAMDTY